MHEYQNGERCPCCGTVIQGKSREWLLSFSLLADSLGFVPWEQGLGRRVEPVLQARREPERTAEG